MGPPGTIWKALETLRRRSPTPERRETKLVRSQVIRARLAAGWHPSHKRKLPDETLRALVAEGFDFRAIAARVRRHPRHVRARLRALGLVDPRRKPPSPIPDAELLGLRASGLSNREIAQRAGVTVWAVNSRLRKLRRRGLTVAPSPAPRPRSSRRFTDEQLLALAQEGLRRAEIVRRLGVATATVSRRLAALRQHGLLPPASRVTDEQLLALAQEGLRPAEIARRLRVSQATVSRRLAALRQRGLLPPAPESA